MKFQIGDLVRMKGQPPGFDGRLVPWRIDAIPNHSGSGDWQFYGVSAVNHIQKASVIEFDLIRVSPLELLAMEAE